MGAAPRVAPVENHHRAHRLSVGAAIAMRGAAISVNARMESQKSQCWRGPVILAADMSAWPWRPPPMV